MDFSALSDAALVESLRELAGRERAAKADFMACLAEAERRESIFVSQGYASLYDFCVRDLKLSQSSAYQRVKAARLTRRRPEIIEYLRQGEIQITTLSMIAPHADERPDLVEAIRDKTRHEVEVLLASIVPGRQLHDRIRILPAFTPPMEAPSLFDARTCAGTQSLTPSPSPKPSPPASSSKSEVLGAPGESAPRLVPKIRAEVRFVATERLLTALERMKTLTWHKYPAGRIEDVLLTALEEYIRRHDHAGIQRPTAVALPPTDPRSRRVPAAIAREVWKRDGSRCTYQGPAGRCPETRGLEVDHVQPWALGGRSDDAANLRLLCRAHNESERRRLGL